jgi:hypothetical protein
MALVDALLNKSVTRYWLKGDAEEKFYCTFCMNVVLYYDFVG